MNVERPIKSAQEQAAASWIDYLNRQRIDELLRSLSQQDIHLEDALRELDELKQSINRLILSDRGGIKGMHGFIAERMQVYFENARSLLDGADKGYYLIDDNGPVDYIGQGTNYQQKFVEKHLSLDAVKKHLEKYPDYIKDGGKYHIPREYYERLKYLWELPQEEAKKLSGEDYRLWKYVKEFFSDGRLDFSDVRPSTIDYKDTQINAADSTVAREEQQIRRQDQEKRKQLYEKSKPSSKELCQASAVSALAEGGVAFCMGVYGKRKAGKRLSAFDTDDWKELGMDTAGAGARGGVRGAVVYGMTNFTATPAAVASSLVTAAFGMLAEAGRLKSGAIDKDDFFIRSEIYCLDATVSAVSSVLGSVIIPVPILGAVIGNMTGIFLYEIAKTAMSEEEQKIIRQYRRNKMELDGALLWQYRTVMGQVEAEMKKFDSLAEWAFSEKANDAFSGSIKLAEHCGVCSDKILRSRQDVERYFINTSP